MKAVKSILVALLVGLYVLSPLDFFPGPVEDILAVIFGVMTMIGKSPAKYFAKD